MISSVMKYIVQLMIILILFNIIFAKYETSSYGQRSSGGKFKYAWFTRDIHENLQQLYRMK
jgi:hypothetical protein